MKDWLKIAGTGTLTMSMIVGAVILFLVGGHVVLGLTLFLVPNVVGLGVLAVK